MERVDRTNNEIQLRTTEAKVIAIKYDPATRVYSREREVGIEALRARDLILARVSKTFRGDSYADLIRLNDREKRDQNANVLRRGMGAFLNSDVRRSNN